MTDEHNYWDKKYVHYCGEVYQSAQDATMVCKLILSTWSGPGIPQGARSPEETVGYSFTPSRVSCPECIVWMKETKFPHCEICGVICNYTQCEECAYKSLIAEGILLEDGSIIQKPTESKRAHCFGCGIEKDMEILEVSPFADEDGLIDTPISPLFVIDCQGPRIPNDPNNSEFRRVVVCHTCFHALSPDMWISEACWDAINPTIPYKRLPMFVDGENDPTQLKPLPTKGEQIIAALKRLGAGLLELPMICRPPKGKDK